MRIVIDAGNGYRRRGGRAAVPGHGLRLVPLYCEMGRHLPQPPPDPTVVEKPEDLIEAVKSEKAEVGIA